MLQTFLNTQIWTFFSSLMILRQCFSSFTLKFLFHTTFSKLYQSNNKVFKLIFTSATRRLILLHLASLHFIVENHLYIFIIHMEPINYKIYQQEYEYQMAFF